MDRYVRGREKWQSSHTISEVWFHMVRAKLRARGVRGL